MTRRIPDVRAPGLPTFAELVRAAVDPTGAEPALDAVFLASHQGRWGRNGGVGCDVFLGPCSCGATHLLDDAGRRI
jgi:hypothetical protein